MKNWRGLRIDLRNYLLSDPIDSQMALKVKFKELRRHINSSAGFLTP
jgi:hypothetical protein